MIEFLLLIKDHAFEIGCITVPTLHLGYVTQFDHTERARHRAVARAAARKVKAALPLPRKTG